MVTHARSGGHLEVMGLLLGKVDANTMVVMDAFALPVEGTETRVNAQSQAYEYMTAYIESAKQVKHQKQIQMGFLNKCLIVSRSIVWKMPSVGIILILDMDVGSQELMFQLKC